MVQKRQGEMGMQRDRHLVNEDRAKQFAELAHMAQVRKYTGERYIAHPAAIAELVRSVAHDDAMICAAWLHDVVEDCGVSIDVIRGNFGDDVAELVEMLTDVSKSGDGNRAVRKAIDREHTAHASARAKTIKLADLIDNSRSILAGDPDFARTYLHEKRQLLAVLSEGDETLFAIASTIVKNGLRMLG